MDEPRRNRAMLDLWYPSGSGYPIRYHEYVLCLGCSNLVQELIWNPSIKGMHKETIGKIIHSSD